MSENKKLKIAFLWHMHQPFYLNPLTNQFLLPWARLHGLKDYLDMPLTAAEFEGMKVTFNLVPSLLDQIQMYCDGYTDRHLELSRIPVRHLNIDEKKEILRTFFSAHQLNMIDPYARYRQLHRKRDSCGSDISLAVETFSTSEWRDLQVWSNLVWIDPMFRSQEPVRTFFEKGRDFTEEEKGQLLDFQIELLKKIIPTYQKLFAENRIDLSFTPYYHPILPLLVDTESAREALPLINLPANRFSHAEDARWQIRQAIEKYRSLFGKNPKGMWPSEGSVSEEVLKIFSEEGIKWVATDQDILQQSLAKSGLESRHFSPHTTYVYNHAPECRLFFRDRGLSDKIGFVYSSWETERAVNDFILNLKRIRDFLKSQLDNCVVPIILDGENAWEYYPDDGNGFLRRLYTALGSDPELEVVSMSDAADAIKPTILPEVAAGSWINHNFRIWIGHSEDNAAWDILFAARKALTDYEKGHLDADPDKLRKAWRQIYIAEGSDWCWWYGDEHQGADNEKFDLLFRLHIAEVYKLLGLAPPLILSQPLHRDRGESLVTLPESLITPQLDGVLTHYYEWSGAGHYNCLGSGGAMHRVDSIITAIYFAFDTDNFYIRLDFARRFDLVGIKNGRVVVDFKNIGQKEIPLEKGVLRDKGDYSYIFNQLLEARFERKALLRGGSGRLEFSVMLYSANESLERWPINDPIAIDLPERDQEIFWQV
ncbi:MAG: glycoside hydrolase family 57 protein [candidate division Zixibacteria bacterium]|nr:glycoside hydrolase family 57 protein [candidate division Zixibacteria bacterium]